MQFHVEIITTAIMKTTLFRECGFCERAAHLFISRTKRCFGPIKIMFHTNYVYWMVWQKQKQSSQSKNTMRPSGQEKWWIFFHSFHFLKRNESAHVAYARTLIKIERKPQSLCRCGCCCPHWLLDIWLIAFNGRTLNWFVAILAVLFA